MLRPKSHKHKIVTGISNSIIVFRIYSCCQISTSFTFIAYSMYYWVPVTSGLIQTDSLALLQRTSELKQLLHVHSLCMSPARLSCHLAHSYGQYRLCSVAWGYVACVARLSYSNSTLHCALRPARLATDYFTRPSPTCPPPPPRNHHQTTTVASSLSSRAGDGSWNFGSRSHLCRSCFKNITITYFLIPKISSFTPPPHHSPSPISTTFFLND